MNMNKRVLILLVGIFTALIAIFAHADNLPQPKISLIPLDGTIAIVNDEIITGSELSNAIQMAKRQLQASGTPLPPDNKLRQDVLNQLIYGKIQLQLAKKYKLEATDEQIKQAVMRIVHNNHLTFTEFKAKLAQGGISLSKFKQQIRNQILIEQLQQMAVSKDVSVTNDDIAQFREKYKAQLESQGKQYNVADLLIPFPDNATAAQKAQTQAIALKVLNQLKQGTNFNTLEQRYPGTNLGWQPLSSLPDVFAPTLQHMKPNTISGVIEAGNGYHILKLLGVQGDAGPSKEQIQQLVYRQKFQLALIKWLEDMRKQAYVKIVNS